MTQRYAHATAQVRKCAVGAAGCIHQDGHWKYFVELDKAKREKRVHSHEDESWGGVSGGGDVRDGGLLQEMLNRLFHRRTGTRLSAVCAIMEMCSWCEGEDRMSPRVRSER